MKKAVKAASEAAATTGTPPQTTLHALYDLDDVEAALGRDNRRSFQGDPDEEGRLTIRHEALQALLDAGETGRWRALTYATGAAIEDVQGLTARAPHMRSVIDLVVRRLRAARTIGMPITLPPMLLLGPPGVGKTWLMARLAERLHVPFRNFNMNLVTLGDTLSGNHPVWRASAPGLVATTLLREHVANPLILVDELDKPPTRQSGGDRDMYRPFYSLLEPEGARRFVDDHLGVPIDAARVMWVAAANCTDAKSRRRSWTVLPSSRSARWRTPTGWRCCAASTPTRTPPSGTSSSPSPARRSWTGWPRRRPAGPGSRSRTRWPARQPKVAGASAAPTSSSRRIPSCARRRRGAASTDRGPADDAPRRRPDRWPPERGARRIRLDPDGLGPLFEAMLVEIDGVLAAHPGVLLRIRDAKEKLGRLSTYTSLVPDQGWNGIRSRVREVVARAEETSTATCDVCGEPGRLRCDDLGWLATRCRAHDRP